MKSPLVLVASALRVTAAQVVNPRLLIETLRSLEQAPYLADAPTGYAEASAGWASSGALLNRMNFGIALALGAMPGVRITGPFPSVETHEVGAIPPDNLGAIRLDELAAAVLPGTETSRLTALIRADLEDNPPVSAHDGATRALGMLLGSPEFQKH